MFVGVYLYFVVVGGIVVSDVTNHPPLSSRSVQTDGFAIAMPVTGVAMGYMGGKGLPFFFSTFAPASGEMGKAKDGKLAGKAYKLHKQIGWYFKWFIPVHVGAVGVHA